MVGGGPKLEIVIDTREQKNWTFEPRQVTVTRACLPAGDYSVVGLETRLALERKSLGDYVQTVIHDWLRFRKELVRLSGYDVAVIVVEANLEQVFRHDYESEASPASVLGRTNAILIEHGIPVLWWSDRKTAAEMAHRFLLMAWRKLYVAGPDDLG
jgi:DNA excision repair protein ERCC-4